MSSCESTQTPFYEEIYHGFRGLAKEHGIVSDAPLDPAMKPGDDGTLKPDGQRACSYILEVDTKELPASLKDQGINRLWIRSYTTQIYDGEVWPARVAIKVHEEIGLSKLFTFLDEEGKITSENVGISDDNEETTELSEGLGEDLTEAEQDEILFSVINGEEHWLEAEGPAGDMARMLDFHLKIHENSPEPEVDEIDLLRMILSAFTKY